MAGNRLGNPASHVQPSTTVFVAEQREAPYAAIAVFILLAMTVVGILHSWWRRRKYLIFGTRKKPGDELINHDLRPDHLRPKRKMPLWLLAILTVIFFWGVGLPIILQILWAITTWP